MATKEENNEIKRIKTIKVIGAGFGRTGTTSLQIALNKLGFPCYHMTEVNSEHIDLWYQSKTTPLRYWDVLFKNYSATVNWPSSSFLFVFLLFIITYIIRLIIINKNIVIEKIIINY